MNNPLVQPDPGLYIWTIATFLVLLAAGEVCLAAAAGGARAASGNNPQVARRCAAGQTGAGKAQCRVAKILAEARVAGFHRVADAVRRRRLRDELKRRRRRRPPVSSRTPSVRSRWRPSALLQIRNEAVDLSITIASKLLERNVTKEDNERLIEETFKQIEARRPS